MRPEWWTEEWKTDFEGGLLCLLMTGVSEPEIVTWLTEKFVTVVRTLGIFRLWRLIVGKCKEMGEEDIRRIRCS